MGEIGPPPVDHRLGEALPGEAAVVELLEPEAGLGDHLHERERRELEAVIGIDTFPIAQGRPHFRAPGARIAGGLTTATLGRTGTTIGTTYLIPDDRIVERFHRTLLDEHFRVEGSKAGSTLSRRCRPRSMPIRSATTPTTHQDRSMNSHSPYRAFLDRIAANDG